MKAFIKIKENRDFRRIYGRGKSFVSPYAVVYLLKNRANNIRLGITAGKKVGGAVARNRAKRVIRAAFSGCLPQLMCGYDFIIVARPRILTVKSTVVEASLRKLFISAGVYEENEKLVD
ncbi:MAG: ribonuclease P protein component [Clostridia bacterium]|nr:ribonuclease P protein component [Clostridia bacterium]